MIPQDEYLFQMAQRTIDERDWWANLAMWNAFLSMFFCTASIALRHWLKSANKRVDDLISENESLEESNHWLKQSVEYSEKNMQTLTKYYRGKAIEPTFKSEYFDTACKENMSVHELNYLSKVFDEILSVFSEQYEGQNGFVLWSIIMEWPTDQSGNLLNRQIKIEPNRIYNSPSWVVLPMVGRVADSLGGIALYTAIQDVMKNRATLQ